MTNNNWCIPESKPQVTITAIVQSFHSRALLRLRRDVVDVLVLVLVLVRRGVVIVGVLLLLMMMIMMMMTRRRRRMLLLLWLPLLLQMGRF
jgi:hypothetical protein